MLACDCKPSAVLEFEQPCHERLSQHNYIHVTWYACNRSMLCNYLVTWFTDEYGSKFTSYHYVAMVNLLTWSNSKIWVLCAL